MFIEAKVSFETKPKKETIAITDMTDKSNPKVSTIAAYNDRWNSTLLVEVADSTTPALLSEKLIKFYADKEKAIVETIKIKKLTKVSIMKL